MIFFAVVLNILPVVSAMGYWTWISGDSGVGAANVFSLTDPLAACPGARASPMDLIQSAGKLVMFGGDSPGGRMGDLWIYDIDRRFWNCSKGNVDRTTPFSLYGGVSGAFHPANTPSGRYGHEISVIQTSNELILFGGYSSGFANDLWQFNFGLNQWKLLSGSSAVNQPGIYGSRGIADAGNIPGGRRWLTMQYSAALGDVVVFGGLGIDSNVNGSSGTLNDLWRFSMVSSRWTWVKGASLYSQAREVIVMRDYHSNNSIGPTTRKPGKLQPGTGHLVIATSNSIGLFLWSFDFALNAWGVIYSSTMRTASYGVISQPSASIWPGTGDAAAIEFFPDGQTLFYGYGLMEKGSGQVRSNDLWMFNLTSLEWTFASGSQLDPAMASFGRKGVSDVTNIPGSRSLPGLAYDGILKKLYVRGGVGDTPQGVSENRLNDLWEYSLADLQQPSVAVGSRSFSSDLWLTLTSKPLLVPPRVSISKSLLSLTVKNVVWIAVVISAGIAFIVFAFCKRRLEKLRRSKLSLSEPTTILSEIDNEISSSISGMEPGVTTIATGEVVFAVPGFLAFRDGPEFRADQKIASGGAGDVYLGTALAAQLQTYGSNIVVKRIREDTIDMESLTRFHQEVSITTYLQTCRNIVKMLGYCDMPPSLLLKFYPHGSLKGFNLNQDNVITHATFISFCKDISNGIEAMHSAGFSHCDIKPDNILLDTDSESRELYCVLTDFGITCVLDDKVLKVGAVKLANIIGLSPAYAAPEIFINFRAKKRLRQYHGDVYAFGIIMNELMTRRRPYEQGQMSWQ